MSVKRVQNSSILCNILSYYTMKYSNVKKNNRKAAHSHGHLTGLSFPNTQIQFQVQKTNNTKSKEYIIVS